MNERIKQLTLQAGLNPSWTRQNADKKNPNFGVVVTIISGEKWNQQ